MQLDARTLLVTLFVCNLLMAGALWIAFAHAFRASLRPWAGGLLAHAFAWLLLLAPHSVAGHASRVIAGTLLAYGCALQLRAFLAFRNKPAPPWIVYGSPLAAFVGLTFWFEAGIALPWSIAGNGFGLLAVQVLTAGASFAFVLMHKVHAHELATTDLLTGVYNRRMFEQLAEAELSRARRARASVSVLMLDLDRFKRVNDMHGHAAGDAVLAAFADIVRRCLRTGDLLARYGGEEFVALLPAADRSAASALAERIRAELAHRPLHAAGREVPITVSIGVASASGEQLPHLETLVDRADQALYAAKADGRNRVAAFSGALAIAA